MKFLILRIHNRGSKLSSLSGRDPAFRLQMLDGYLKDAVWGAGESASLRCGVKYNGAASVRWLKRVENGRRKNAAFGIEKPSVVKLDDGHLYEVHTGTRAVSILISKESQFRFFDCFGPFFWNRFQNSWPKESKRDRF